MADADESSSMEASNSPVPDVCDRILRLDSTRDELEVVAALQNLAGMQGDDGLRSDALNAVMAHCAFLASSCPTLFVSRMAVNTFCAAISGVRHRLQKLGAEFVAYDFRADLLLAFAEIIHRDSAFIIPIVVQMLSLVRTYSRSAGLLDNDVRVRVLTTILRAWRAEQDWVYAAREVDIATGEGQATVAFPGTEEEWQRFTQMPTKVVDVAVILVRQSDGSQWLPELGCTLIEEVLLAHRRAAPQGLRQALLSLSVAITRSSKPSKLLHTEAAGELLRTWVGKFLTSGSQVLPGSSKVDDTALNAIVKWPYDFAGYIRQPVVLEQIMTRCRERVEVPDRYGLVLFEVLFTLTIGPRAAREAGAAACLLNVMIGVPSHIPAGTFYSARDALEVLFDDRQAEIYASDDDYEEM